VINLGDFWAKLLTRRRLLALLGIGAGIFGLQRLWRADEPAAEPLAGVGQEREAMFYLALEGGRAGCKLCFRQCIILPGDRSFCRNRENRGGRLINIVYGLPSAVHVDPIEKEPLHHFLPGSDILCIGTAGCNFRCKFCHNWHLSQRSLEEMFIIYQLPPEMAVAEAKKQGVPSISFTYNEPTSLYEYMYDVARLARAENIRLIFHSNGAMAVDPLQALLKYTDAVTIDLKAFSERFYREICQAELAPVLLGLKTIKDAGIWLEIVNLVIPGQNDSPQEVREMAAWIRGELGPEVPLHFSRFFPNYRMTDVIPTPVSTLENCREIAVGEGLKFVSVGNVPGHQYNSTFCPACKEVVIRRHHFTVLNIEMDAGACRHCGQVINGVWR
jgi:pyruvate formate lyase activating enzyme